MRILFLSFLWPPLRLHFFGGRSLSKVGCSANLNTWLSQSPSLLGNIRQSPGLHGKSWRYTSVISQFYLMASYRNPSLKAPEAAPIGERVVAGAPKGPVQWLEVLIWSGDVSYEVMHECDSHHGSGCFFLFSNGCWFNYSWWLLIDCWLIVDWLILDYNYFDYPLVI